MHFLPSRIWNQLFGPKNGFEELIEWTKKGKMWPYPINNEYLLGGEENVSVIFMSFSRSLCYFTKRFAPLV